MEHKMELDDCNNMACTHSLGDILVPGSNPAPRISGAPRARSIFDRPQEMVIFFWLPGDVTRQTPQAMSIEVWNLGVIQSFSYSQQLSAIFNFNMIND